MTDQDQNHDNKETTTENYQPREQSTFSESGEHPNQENLEQQTEVFQVMEKTDLTSDHDDTSDHDHTFSNDVKAETEHTTESSEDVFTMTDDIPPTSEAETFSSSTETETLFPQE